MKIVAFLLVCISLASCGMKSELLQDKITKIPADTTFYKNKTNYNALLNMSIDTTCIYEEYDTYKKELSRLDTQNPNSWYGVYKFYAGGRVNLFIIDRNEDVNKQSFNPELKGYRGVYYSKKNKILTDMYVPVTQNRAMGRSTSVLTNAGDTLYLNDGIRQRVYVKNWACKQSLKHRADW